jgi:hypothetical protein
VCNCASSYFLNVNGQIDPSLMMIFVDLQCMLCKQSLGVVIMLICN